MWENISNMVDVVKKLQNNVESLQDHLKQQRLEISTGDMLTVVVNGRQELVSISLAPRFLTPDNALLLQDLLVTAINSALTQSRELQEAAMQKLTGDLNLPKIPGLF